MTAEPVIDSYGGTVVKFEADNCFATFLDPLKAVRCGIALNVAFNASNILTPDELDIGISCGIDHGPILVVDGKDFFGNPVNRACKLGEDVSGPGEIIVTREAMAEIPEQTDIVFDSVQFTISGITIDAFVVNHWRKSGQIERPAEAVD
jgi:class 3 adenylate cyclase